MKFLLTGKKTGLQNRSIVKQVGVIGAGIMGRGISQWFAQQGVCVHMADISSTAVEKSLKSIMDSWTRLTEKGKFSKVEKEQFEKNINPADVDRLPSSCQLVIEAVVEDFDVKKNLFARLNESLPKETVIASNTSSFSIQKLAEELPCERKKSFLGLHFFNPAPVMKLVEVICPPQTDKKVASSLARWLGQKGKITAICRDTPGFIVNRIARNFYGEALRIAQRDDRDKYKEIDRSLKEVGGFPMGPFELMDLIGIDVNLNATRSLWNSFHKTSRFAPHLLQEKMVRDGRLGRKSGKGFYLYE